MTNPNMWGAGGGGTKFLATAQTWSCLTFISVFYLNCQVTNSSCNLFVLTGRNKNTDGDSCVCFHLKSSSIQWFVLFLTAFMSDYPDW